MSLDVYLTEDGEEKYSANITHNLNTLAEEVFLYQALWRPEELSITHAEQLVPLLIRGLDRLVKGDREAFRKLEPANGWGTYDGLKRFVANYLVACIEYPEASVRVSR